MNFRTVRTVQGNLVLKRKKNGESGRHCNPVGPTCRMMSLAQVSFRPWYVLLHGAILRPSGQAATRGHVNMGGLSCHLRPKGSRFPLPLRATSGSMALLQLGPGLLSGAMEKSMVCIHPKPHGCLQAMLLPGAMVMSDCHQGPCLGL